MLCPRLHLPLCWRRQKQLFVALLSTAQFAWTSACRRDAMGRISANRISFLLYPCTLPALELVSIIASCGFYWHIRPPFSGGPTASSPPAKFCWPLVPTMSSCALAGIYAAATAALPRFRAGLHPAQSEHRRILSEPSSNSFQLHRLPQEANPAGRHIGELSTSEIKRASYPRISNLRSAGVALALNSLSAAYQPRIPALDFRGLLWGNALLTILYHKMYDLSSTLKYSTHWNNTNSINYNAP